MASSTVVVLSKKSEDAFIAYYRAAQNLQTITRHELRGRFEFIDRTYQRELDHTIKHKRAQQANFIGDPSRYQDMTVPIVMPQVEAAVTHQSSVFLTSEPLFPVVAAPAFIDEALQMETIIENDSIRGGWARELMMFFRDGFKYNFAPLEVSWAQQVTYEIETDISVDTKEGQAKKTIWTGNKIRRLDPYNTFVDTRVAASELYSKGEFGGWTEIMSRIALKDFIASLPDKLIRNIVPAFESQRQSLSSGTDSGAQNYYVPQINSKILGTSYLQSGTFNWLSWAGLANTGGNPIDYKESYEVTTLYARILPSDFDLRAKESNTPQIYKLIIVNHEFIIYAELQTNAHHNLPILIGEPSEDGLGYQTKSLATNGTPFQELATASMAAVIASRRRAISDRTLYDPSRVTRADINSENPAAKIPVRPSAYGKKVSDAVYQFPYNEDQYSVDMAQIQTVVSLANQLTGQNPVSQGQFIKGNKTNRQFDDVMANATGRDQLVSLLLEFQVFVPMKEILKVNILQFQGGTTLYNRNKQVAVEIDPIKLRKALLEFRVSDGLVPADEILNSETYTVAIQAIASNPELAASYNLAPAFSYLTKTQGADLTPFEKSSEQVAYEQALTAWQGLAQLAIEKGLDPEDKLPPQPKPEDFGYTPANNDPSASASNDTLSAPAQPNLESVA